MRGSNSRGWVGRLDRFVDRFGYWAVWATLAYFGAHWLAAGLRGLFL